MRDNGLCTKVSLIKRFHCIQLLFGSLSLPKANSIPKYRDANEKARPRLIFLSFAHLCVIGGDFVLESVARYAALVRYSEFGSCRLFGSRKCTASTGIAVGTSTVVRYSERSAIGRGRYRRFHCIPFSHEIGSDRQQIFAGNFRQDNNMRACVIQPKSNHTLLHRNARA